MTVAEISEQLSILLGQFPEDQRPTIRASAAEEAWGELAERFPGGHCQRWFAACDGQDTAYPFYDAHTLMCLRDAADAMRIADTIRAEPEGYWVEPEWLAIAGDGAGQQVMIDDRDGRVLRVAHDDDQVDVLADSPEAWLESLCVGLDAGSIQWDPTFGLVETRVLEDVAAYKRRQAERKAAAQLTTRQKVDLALSMLIAMGLIGLLIWWLESRR